MNKLSNSTITLLVTIVFLLISINKVNCQNISTNTNTTTFSEERSQFGGNFASYNEPCILQGQEQNGKFCASNQNLICQDNVCKCTSNYFYIALPGINACMEEPSSDNSWACIYDQQCDKSKFGKYSRCNDKATPRECECYDTEGKSRETFKVDDVCYVKKSIGSGCENNLQCNLTIIGDTFCNGASPATATNLNMNTTSTGICSCAENSIEFNSTTCLPLKSINETCEEHIQCNHTKSLGNLASCFAGTCSCLENKDSRYYIPYPNPNGIKGKCYVAKNVNETCTTTEECVLGYHPHAVCLVHESYNGETVCQCPVGKKCIQGENDDVDDASSALSTRIDSIKLNFLMSLPVFVIISIV